MRELPQEGSFQRTRRASRLQQLPRRPLGQDQGYGHLRKLPCEGASEQTCERHGWLSDVPSTARAERRRCGPLVRVVSCTRQAARATRSPGTCRLHAMPLVARRAASGPRNVHEGLPHESSESSADGADVQWLSRLPEVTVRSVRVVDHAVDVEPAPERRDGLHAGRGRCGLGAMADRALARGRGRVVLRRNPVASAAGG